ncbi:MAG: hypothetical protein HUU18_00380 [Phycisphaerales bacterium]|nr:hypothetical protein [Phycisphaerales bacterium]
MIPIETQPERRTLPVLAGLAVSGLVHLAAMAGLAMSPGIEAGSIGERKVGVLILPPAERTPDAAATTPEPKAEAAPEPKPEQEPEAIRAGIEDSNAVSPNWQGFNEREATEHAAAKSSVEQAALALNPGSPAPAAPAEVPRNEPPTEPQATPEAAGEPHVPQEAAKSTEVTPPVVPQPPSSSTPPVLQAPPAIAPPAAQQPESRPATVPVGEPPSPATPVTPELEAGEIVEASSDAAHDAMLEKANVEAAAASDTANDTASDTVGDAGERVEKDSSSDLKALWALFAPPPNATSPLSPPPPIAPSANTPAAPTTPQASLATAQPGGDPGQIGLASDAESDASSIKEAIEYRLGKPLAGKGLKIRTMRPNWSVTTRLTASPRNPVVRVVFGRDGRVLEAKFVAGQETGYPDVDAPILHAVYRWTASGEALTKLPAGDPRAGVTMTFRMILRE